MIGFEIRELTDGDIDAADLTALEACFSGPGLSPAPPPPLDAGQCLNTFDTDLDGDSDLVDFMVMQTAAGDDGVR